MNAGIDLARIGMGFGDPTFDSQRVFRAVLQVLSRPGEVAEIGVSVDVPPGLHPAAGALLLALLDQDTRLWLSPSLRSDVAPYLRFHTSCAQVIDPARADFALVARPGELPPLAAFARGDERYPDRSTTLVLQVPSLSGSPRWTLSGPGIDGAAEVGVEGMRDDFAAEWNAHRRIFPCGVDLFLCADRLLLGLPRTTHIGT